MTNAYVPYVQCRKSLFRCCYSKPYVDITYPCCHMLHSPPLIQESYHFLMEPSQHLNTELYQNILQLFCWSSSLERVLFLKMLEIIPSFVLGFLSYYNCLENQMDYQQLCSLKKEEGVGLSTSKGDNKVKQLYNWAPEKAPLEDKRKSSRMV